MNGPPYGALGCSCSPVELDHPDSEWHRSNDCTLHGRMGLDDPMPTLTGGPPYREVEVHSLPACGFESAVAPPTRGEVRCQQGRCDWGCSWIHGDVSAAIAAVKALGRHLAAAHTTEKEQRERPHLLATARRWWRRLGDWLDPHARHRREYAELLREWRRDRD